MVESRRTGWPPFVPSDSQPNDGEFVEALKGFGCEVEEIDYTQSRTIEKSQSNAGMRSVADPVLVERKKGWIKRYLKSRCTWVAEWKY